MSKILDERCSFLESVDLFSYVKAMEPITTEGFRLKKEILENFESFNSVTGIKAVIERCQKAITMYNDDSIYALNTYLNERMEEEIDKVKFFYVYENIGRTVKHKNFIARANEAIKNVYESEDPIKKIRYGAFNDFKRDPFMAMLYNEAHTIKQDEKYESDNISINHLTSYNESKDGKDYFAVDNYFFECDGDNLTFAKQAPSYAFRNISDVLRQAQIQENGDIAINTHVGSFLVNNEGVYEQNNDTKVFEKVEDVQLFLEAKNTLLNKLHANRNIDSFESNKSQRLVESLHGIFHNIKEIKENKDITVVYNKKRNEKMLYAKINETYYTICLESVRWPRQINKFEDSRDALKNIYERMGVDITSLHTFDIKVSEEFSEKKKALIEEKKRFVEQLEQKHKEVKETLYNAVEDNEKEILEDVLVTVEKELLISKQALKEMLV